LSVAGELLLEGYEQLVSFRVGAFQEMFGVFGFTLA